MQNILIVVGVVVAVVILSRIASNLRGRQQNQMDYPQGLRPDTEPNSGTDEIRRMVLAGNKIEAIKQYRKIHGVGLKEAKDAVEKLLGENSAGTP
jgi:ribosomal protein L7/L12